MPETITLVVSHGHHFCQQLLSDLRSRNPAAYERALSQQDDELHIVSKSTEPGPTPICVYANGDKSYGMDCIESLQAV